MEPVRAGGDWCMDIIFLVVSAHLKRQVVTTDPLLKISLLVFECSQNLTCRKEIFSTKYPAAFLCRLQLPTP